MVIVITLLLVGLALVLIGGNIFVRASIGIAEWLRVPHAVMGGTLMALATTSPEVVVAITAGLQGNPGLAVGNAVGSILCNFALIASLMAVISPLTVRRGDVAVGFSALAVFCVVYFVLTRGGVVHRWESLLLLTTGSLYFITEIWRSIRGRAVSTLHDSKEIIQEPQATGTPWSSILLFVVGASVVVGGSRLLVFQASFLAERVGIPSMVIGLTIVAIGTSLPELITAVVAARKGVAELAVGNLIGANIVNLTIATGSAGVLIPLPVTRADNLLHFPALFLVVAVMGALLIGLQHLGRATGVALIIAYVIYLITVVSFSGFGT